ncbi:MAG TPA: 1,4-dihydroxy-2-naphthoate octaprenyltransferase [Opitutae bacterium]|nr:1,4-dihydroxy-2-naphthoate octaprenyltransferase [Opitutae bacterium]
MPSLLLWVKVSRPKTLIASVAPILVAVKNFSDNHEVNDLSLIVLLGCLSFITLVQISTNLANDYFDWKRGADRFRGNAPERLVTTGKIEGKKVLTVVFILLILSFLVGVVTLYISSSSIWFLPLGVLCIALAILYTAGPYPLAYNGLGDLFVVLFFGLVAVEGTNYFLSSANSVPYEMHLGSALHIGLLINNLLVVNNYRDYESDLKVGKNTTVVIFGKKFGALLYLVGFLFPVFHGYYEKKILVVLILTTSAISFIFLLKSHLLKNANRALSFSALSVLIYSVCWML